MRFAYADPPYIGMAHLYPEQAEVDHPALIEQLQDFDAWALSCHTPSLRQLLPLCPEKTRVGAWVKSYNSNGNMSRPVYAWEPVLFKPGRYQRRNLTWDWLKCPPVHAVTRTVYGQKPEEFSYWLFGLLGAEPGDDFVDLFPGSGAVTRAWDKFCGQLTLSLTASKAD